IVNDRGTYVKEITTYDEAGQTLFDYTTL
uniref:Uncharacterized protein n=1 Tax=Caenorhabditis japonica TaxID=281687 RepID=A0A8R1ELG8_CAEJA